MNAAERMREACASAVEGWAHSGNNGLLLHDALGRMAREIRALPVPEDAVGEARERLTFRYFQRANVVRCRTAFNRGLGDWSLLEWAGAAAGEMGEAANVCKKILRQKQDVDGSWAERDPDAETLRVMLADEIGDTLAYLALLSAAAGLDLGECGARKFDAVSEKVGYTGPRLLAASTAAREAK